MEALPTIEGGSASSALPRGAALTASLLIAISAIYQLLLAPPDGSNRVGCMLGAIGVMVAAVLCAIMPIGGRRVRYRRHVSVLAALLIGEAVLLCFFNQFPDGAGGQIKLLPIWGERGAVVLGRLALTIAAFTLAALVASIVVDRRAGERMRFQTGRSSRATGRFRSAVPIVLISLAAVLHVVTAIIMFHRFPTAGIDVTVFHQDGTAALLQGRNPYAITFPNVYSHDGSPSPYYSLEVQHNGRVLFGYPYPPLCLLIMTAGHLITADPRCVMSVCIGLAAIVTAGVGRGPLSLLAAAFMLIAPGALVVENLSWTEPQSLLALAVVAWAATRRSKTLPIWLGLFFALKQYNVIFAPLLFLLLPRPITLGSALRFLGLVLLTAAAVSLPLILWNPSAFWHSNVYIQLIQPFRYDSFSLLAAYARSLPAGSPPPSGAIAFVMLLPTLALLLWKLPRNIAGFVLGAAVTMIVFLMFNRQAFLNYHTFASGALLIAAATYEGVYAVRTDQNSPPNPLDKADASPIATGPPMLSL